MGQLHALTVEPSKAKIGSSRKESIGQKQWSVATLALLASSTKELNGNMYFATGRSEGWNCIKYLVSQA